MATFRTFGLSESSFVNLCEVEKKKKSKLNKKKKLGAFFRSPSVFSVFFSNWTGLESWNFKLGESSGYGHANAKTSSAWFKGFIRLKHKIVRKTQSLVNIRVLGRKFCSLIPTLLLQFVVDAEVQKSAWMYLLVYGTVTVHCGTVVFAIFLNGPMQRVVLINNNWSHTTFTHKMSEMTISSTNEEPRSSNYISRNVFRWNVTLLTFAQVNRPV